MISPTEEHHRTNEYTDCLQQILLGLRAVHSPQECEALSKAYLEELTKAHQEIAVFLATPAPEMT